MSKKRDKKTKDGPMMAAYKAGYEEGVEMALDMLRESRQYGPLTRPGTLALMVKVRDKMKEVLGKQEKAT